MISDVADADGRLVEQAPRSILKRQVARLQDAGLTATFASELEFYLFRTPYRQAWASGYRDLEPSYHLHADNDILIAGYDHEFVGSVRRPWTPSASRSTSGRGRAARASTRSTSTTRILSRWPTGTCSTNTG